MIMPRLPMLCDMQGVAARKLMSNLLLSGNSYFWNEFFSFLDFSSFGSPIPSVSDMYTTWMISSCAGQKAPDVRLVLRRHDMIPFNVAISGQNSHCNSKVSPKPPFTLYALFLIWAVAPSILGWSPAGWQRTVSWQSLQIQYPWLSFVPKSRHFRP